MDEVGAEQTVDTSCTNTTEHFVCPELNQDIIDLGARVLSSIIDWRDWVHRKVESLDLLPRDRGRRRVSVDCTPTGLHWGSVENSESDGGSSTLIPLTLMAKEPLQGLDVTDDSGRSIPVLGSSANALLAASALAFIAWVAMDRDLDRVKVLWPKLHDVAAGSSISAGLTARALIEELTLDGVASKVFDDLAECFLLTVVLASDEAHHRQVIKYSYYWEAGDGRRGGLVHFWYLFTAGLGLRRFTMSVEMGASYTARSYHLECVAPDGLLSAGMDLPVDGSGDIPHSVARAQIAHAIGRYPPYRTPRAQTAVVRFDLDPSGLVPRVFWAAAAVAALFAIMILTPGVYEALTTSIDAATALLLFIPALLVALNVRGPEHAVVGRLLLPLRVGSIVLSLSLFVAGAMLVLKAPQSVVESFWIASVIFAASFAAITLAGLIRLKVVAKR